MGVKTEAIKTVISMAKTVELLKLKLDDVGGTPVPTDVSDINMLCPMCAKQHTTKRRTMNINFEQNVFGCNRCHFSGGPYKLISYYRNWPMSEVERRVLAGELDNFVPTAEDAVDEDSYYSSEAVGNDNTLMARLSQRHEVYTAMLEMLTLEDAHRQDLLRRGLTNDEIERFQFRSWPRYMAPNVLPQKLINKGYDLRGVPGFGVDASMNWAIARMPDSGYLIPNRNGRGLIQGFQIRFDHPNDKTPKYGYFSSKGMRNGTKCDPWYCWVGEDIVTREENTPFDVILIEGPLKAYIVGCRTQCNIISVPGVTALKKIPRAIQEMQQFGLRKVLIAYDMDSETNADVKKQLDRLRSILTDIDVQHETLQWDSNYKGLDDWITESEEFKSIMAEVLS